MLTGEYVCTMAHYNQWMNQKIYAVVSQLTGAQRRADKGAFFKSIHATLAHLVWGDSMWMSRLTDNPSLVMSTDAVNDLSFEQMHARRNEIDSQILKWAEHVNAEWMAADKTWISAMYQKTFTRPIWLLIMQMFNHQTHHRGQVMTLLSQYGLDVGATDLPVMPMFENYGE